MSDELLRIFKPPWRIVRDGESGHYRIHDAGEKVLCWIYIRKSETGDYHLPSDREARLLAQAFARVSKREDGEPSS